MVAMCINSFLPHNTYVFFIFSHIQLQQLLQLPKIDEKINNKKFSINSQSAHAYCITMNNNNNSSSIHHRVWRPRHHHILMLLMVQQQPSKVIAKIICFIMRIMTWISQRQRRSLRMVWVHQNSKWDNNKWMRCYMVYQTKKGK